MSRRSDEKVARAARMVSDYGRIETKVEHFPVCYANTTAFTVDSYREKGWVCVHEEVVGDRSWAGDLRERYLFFIKQEDMDRYRRSRI